MPFSDFVPAPNITSNPAVYALENAAIERDGRLDQALYNTAPWDDQALLDIGCGTGFWLHRYARLAGSVVGIEPDARLRALAGVLPEDTVLKAGSAESIPLPDHSVDIAHARFAYFFGKGAERGLAEVRRVLKPQGTFIAVDNAWSGGDFAWLLNRATTGNAAHNPQATEAWWAAQGARRIEVQAGWQAESVAQLEAILRIEFPGPVVDDFVAWRADRGTHTPALSYRVALYVIGPQ